MEDKEMRVPREWVWVVILVAVLAIALLGCAHETKKVEPKEEQEPRLTYLPPAKVTSQRVDWGLYAITFEGHLYLWEMDGFLLHAASCKGVHTLVGP